MRALLTGADGYVGRPVQQALLSRGFEVHAISRQHRSDDSATTWHAVDLLDAAASNDLISELGATHFVHLAWVTEPGAYWQSTDNALWRDASLELLNSFVASGGTRAVLVGTCAEYDLRGGHCVEEKTPLRGQSPYTAAKLAFREAAISLARKSKLEVAWARVFFSFGPHEHPQRLISSVVRDLLAGDRASCTDGKQIRDFMYVDDLADALVAVLGSDFQGDINIASGQAMTIKNLVTLVAARLDALDRVDFGARPRQDGEAPSITADVSRLQNVVGWSAGDDLGAAIDATIAWWRQEIHATNINTEH